MAKRPPSIPRLAPLQRIASYPVRVLVVAGEDTWRGAVVKFLAAEGFRRQGSRHDRQGPGAPRPEVA